MKSRIIRRIAERLAEPHDRGIQTVIKVDKGIVGQSRFRRSSAGDNLTAFVPTRFREFDRVCS